MSKILFLIILSFMVSASSVCASDEPSVIYWNSEAGKILHARIPADAPYGYFTQSNYFTPEGTKIINPQTVLTLGMTREQMAETLYAAKANRKGGVVSF